MNPARRAVGTALAVVAVLSLAVTMRGGAASPGPLIDSITGAFGLGETAGGIVSALPGLCFGAVGILAVPIGRRLGLTGTILLAAALAAAGLLLRPLVGSYALFVMLSAVALAGPAIGNVLLPAWIKRHGGTSTVLLMTIYTVMIAVSGGLGSLLAVPVADARAGWRGSLLLWGLIALPGLLVWGLVLRRTGHDFPPRALLGDDDRGEGSLLRSPTAIALTVLFGLQSMNAYVQMGWLPRIYIDAGLAPAVAGALTALISGLGILGGLVMPSVAARTRRLRWIVLALGVITAAGYAGLLVAPHTLAVLWAVLLGIGGFTFSTAIALIPLRSGDPQVTARLSGMVQPVGYVLAAIGPMAVGLAHEARDDWSAVLVGLVVACLVMGAIGFRAAAPRLVDDELHG